MTNTSIDKKILNISIGILVAIILASVSFAFNAGKQFESTSNDIHSLEVEVNRLIDDGKSYEDRLAILESENSKTQVELAKIQTKLTSIEALLVDLKNDLKNKK